MGLFGTPKQSLSAATLKGQTHFDVPNGDGGGDAELDNALTEKAEQEGEDEERQARPVIKLRSPRRAMGKTLSRSRSRRDLSLAAEDVVSLDATDQESVANIRFSAHIVSKVDVADQLPFAFIAPERNKRRKRPASADTPMVVSPPSLDEEIPQTPSSGHNAKLPYLYSPPEDLKGVFTRKYRWGTIDVLDPSHCDFSALRTAALSTHLKVLQSFDYSHL